MEIIDRPKAKSEREIVHMLRSLDIDDAKVQPIVNALDRFITTTIEASFNIARQRARYHYWNGFAQGVCVAVFVASLGMLLR